MESAPRYGVLGRHTACSTKRIQIQSNKIERIILHDTLPANGISKVVVMKSENIIYQEENVSPRPPPKISYKDNWMCDLDSDVAESSKDTQRIQPKPKTQWSRTVRPACGPESTKRCVLTPKHVVEDQTGSGRPVLVDQKEEHEIDFRVPGLSHAVVKDVNTLPPNKENGYGNDTMKTMATV